MLRLLTRSGKAPLTRIVPSEKIAQQARTRLIDGALPPAILPALRREAAVAHARRGDVSTWWTSSEQLSAAAGAPASASATECALAMLLHHASGGDLEVSRRVVGAEWWVQHRSLSAPKGFHFDVDQEQQRRVGALRSPALSSILYLTDAGGPTLILDQVATICSWSGHVLLSPPEPAEADVIHPLANRFVLFRAACLHGCLPPLGAGCGVEGAEAAEQPKRTTLLVNWWIGERPAPPSCAEAPPSLLDEMRRASAPHYAEALAAGGGAWKWDEAVARPLDVSDVGTGEACQQVCLEVPLPAGEGPNGRAQAANTPVDLLLPLAGLDCVRVTGMGRVRLQRAMMDS